MLIKYVLALCFILFSLTGYAEISVSPVRVAMSANKNMTVLRITNSGNKPASFQLDLKKWTQLDNKDIFSSADKVLLMPRMITLNPDQTQAIRIAIRPDFNRLDEAAFRLFIKEVIASPEVKENSDLKFSLELRLPVFILPVTQPKVDYFWKIDNISNQTATVSIQNNSNVHVFGSELKITDNKGQVVGKVEQLLYVLPHSKRSWKVKLSSKILNKEQLNIHSNLGEDPIAEPAI